MGYPVHHVPAGDVLPIFFDTFDGGTGASITMSGLAVTDIEIYKDGSTTQRASDAGYTLLDTDGIDFDGLTGIHGFSIDTGDNTDSGFYTVGAWFHVVVSAVTVDAQTVSFIAAAFRIVPAESSAGVPKVDLTHISGSAVSTTTAQLGVNAVQISGDGTAADNLETAFDDTAGPVPWLGIVDQGTAQSASSTGVVLRAAAAFADDTLIGCTIGVLGSTQAYWQFREITDNALSGDSVTVDAWTVTPSGTITYKIFGGPPASLTALPAVNVVQISGDATAADNAEAFFDGTGYAGTNNVIPTVTTVGTVNALANNSITAAAAAADFGTEVGSAVWASAARTLTALDEDSTTLDLDSTIRAAVGLASANLDTEIAAILADTNELQTDWANGGRLDLILDARASQTSVDDLPTNAELATALAAADDAVLAAVATVDSNVDTILVTTNKLDDTLEDDGGTFRFTTNALEQAPSGGASAADIADAVWEEAIADHSGTSGSTAEALSAAGAAGDPWITALPGSYSSGQAGFIIGTNLNATVSSRATQTSVDTIDDLLDTEVAALTTELAKVPKSDGTATWNATALASIQAEATDALNAYDPPTNAELTTALDAIPTAVENADALLNRDMSVGTDSGSATVRTPRQALRILRNKWSIDSGGVQTITKEDDSTTSWTQQLTSDGAAEPVVGTDPAGP